ncbi:tRNA (N6-threonylcarbamoyladenosine(37)-N6)-methyltransferase TrmO [Lentisphaerota bacterium WC36G]|nr:tRNA (N6-threonylcarbamoyladenosine(37)-N6)-methyltransferase TrmO [Lentisphaerae bacterium WC36]
MDNYTFSPIGYLHCDEKYKAHQPRQGVFAKNRGIIQLKKHHNFEQALQDLAGVDRIWVIFVFHENHKWKPLVQPPINNKGKKVGVFATRSPYRPNNIGMSCVKIIDVNIKNLTLTIENFDLIDNTPILDIKPYIVTADSFPNSHVQWLDNATNQQQYSIATTVEFDNKANFIEEVANLNLYSYCVTQLSNDPLNNLRKRVKILEFEENCYSLGCRTWKIIFKVCKVTSKITLLDILSNYQANELTNQAVKKEDKYKEKKFHQAFHKKFIKDT